MSRSYWLTQVLMLRKKDADRIFFISGFHTLAVVFLWWGEKKYMFDYLENKSTNLQLYSHFETA